MHTTSWSRNTQGYVLVIVMGLLAALGVMALSLGAATRVDLAQTRRFQDETAAELLAKAGIDWTIHYLNTVARQGTLWQAPWTSQAALFQDRPLGAGAFDVQYTDPGGTLHYGLQDEEARVNLNTAPVAVLAVLPGVGPELAEAIVKYRQQGPWEAPEDLLHHGLVSPPVWYGSTGQVGLSAYLTVWGSGKININTASPMIMAAVPGMTPALVEAIVRYRQGDDQQLGTSDDRYFHTVADLATLPGVDHGGWSVLGPS
jgi:DNA uptake protein ComE-like DNA-binding protein